MSLSPPPPPARAANPTTTQGFFNPPPLPHRDTTISIPKNVKDKIQPDEPLPDIAYLLARRPPPPPVRAPSLPPRKQPSTLPSLPPRRPGPEPQPEPSNRRLPPRLSPAPPPPAPNLASKPKLPLKNIPTSTITCLKCRSFAEPDAHAALFPLPSNLSTPLPSLHDLAQNLTSPFPSTVDKARAIFTWLHFNISYDTNAFFSGNLKAATPESTLASRTAVCDGYAGLFYRLAQLAGLQARRVEGHGKGWGYVPPDIEGGEEMPKYTMNHAWNAIWLDDDYGNWGYWHLIDSCWGAGAVSADGSFTRRLEPRWFVLPPHEFTDSHFPSDVTDQILEYPLSWEEYILLPPGPQLFTSFYQYGLAQAGLVPPQKRLQGEQYVRFELRKGCMHMSVEDEDNHVFFVLSRGSMGKRTVLELCANDNGYAFWAADVWVPHGDDVTLCTVSTVNGEDARGITSEGFTRASGRMAMSFDCLVKWEVV